MSFLYISIKYISLFFLLLNKLFIIDGSIFLDWASNIPDDLNVLHYQLDYTPNVGEPPPKSIFPIRYTNAIINNTLPAREYKISLVAVLADGARIPLINKFVPSSPYPPRIKNITTSTTEALIEYEPPKGQVVTYYIEYFPSNNEELSNYVETQATTVRLKSLLPKTLYILRIYSVYKGMPSDSSNEEGFMTKGSQGTSMKEPSIPFSIKTLPPFFKPIQTPASNNVNDKPPTLSPTFFVEQAKEFFATSTTTTTTTTYAPTTVLPFSFDTLNFKKEFLHLFTSLPSDRKTEFLTTSTPIYPDFSKPDYFKPLSSSNWNFESYPKNSDSLKNIFTTTTLSITTSTNTPSTNLPSTTTLQSQSSINKLIEGVNGYQENVTNNDNKKELKLNKVVNKIFQQKSIKKNTSEVVPVNDKNEVNNNEEGDIIFEDKSTETLSTTTVLIPILTEESAILNLPLEPSDLSFEKIDNNLVIKWEVPETILCDNYIANLTYLTGSKQSYVETSDENEVKFKFPDTEKATITVYCSYDGSIVNTWWGYRLGDFTKPRSVDQFKVDLISTDEFYLSTVKLSWSSAKAKSDKYYDILVSYSYGKTSQNKKEIVVEEGNSVVIDKLNPATLYTFTVKNISIEFNGLASKARGLRQLTPPVITSTLYPGQISSNAININFGDSDPEHAFDSYELIFVSPTKNITKALKKTDEKSFTFNKLIPGKTYTFILHTIYKNIRSRPVISKVTTYPLKVTKLYPILGSGYASLYWDVENVGDSTTKYRLSYVTETKSGDRRSGTVVLKDVNKHRFEELDYDLYYTFTITVIMGEDDAEAESESETITVILKQYNSNLPVLRRQGMRELNVAFDNDRSFNTDTNGNVDNFAIIVAETLSNHDDDFDLKTWFDVKSEDKWTSYRASPSTFNPFKNGVKKASFVIGEEECDRRKLNEPYCNGALKSNVDYFVKIRAYTERNVAIETEWVSVHGVVDEDSPKESSRKLPCHMYLNGCPRNSSRSNILVYYSKMNFILLLLISQYLLILMI